MTTKKRLPRHCIQRAFMSIKSLPHHSIQRAFLIWYKENRTRIQVPLQLTKITAYSIELRFQSYSDCLSVRLSSNELAVHVNWQGEWWDMIVDLDAWACQTQEGYKCKICMHEKGDAVKIFPCREALWLDHLFDPLLELVNEELASARWLRISCTNDRGARWVKLIRDNSELSKPDRTMLLLQQLKRIDGTPCYEGGPEGITNWLVPLRNERPNAT